MSFAAGGRDAFVEADGLCRFIDASPSPYHATATAGAMLREAGFVPMEQADAWAGPGSALPTRGYLVRQGSLVAWDLTAAGTSEDAAPASPVSLVSPVAVVSATSAVSGASTVSAPHTPFRIVGAHTDSPNLRIKPNPDLGRGGWDRLSVEVYGGALLNSWLDRDLGLSGRVMVRRRDARTAGACVEQRLVRVDDPVLRIPQLANHLDRTVNTEGLRLNPQTHLVPVWGATGAAPAFTSYLAELSGCGREDVLGWDVMTHDLTPSRRVGRTGDLIAGPRLDNLASSYAAIRALVEAAAGPVEHRGLVPVIVLFDHEEIGSTTDRGAASPLLMSVLERLVLARGGGRDDLWRALGGTVIASADMAHAVHPNYPERHEPQHQPMVNAGPVVKVNNLGRYATDGPGLAVLRLAAEQAGVPLQVFLSRGDMPCGSTIGPFVAAATGATTVDLGCALLGMHSAREVAGSADPASYVAMLAAFLRPAGPVIQCATGE